MSLALLYGAAGSHPASWMHRESRLAPPTDLAAYTHAARTAERGLFDLFFIADTPAARTDNLQAWSRFPLFMNVLEPVTLLTALAGVTTRIGLGGTVSTSFSEPTTSPAIRLARPSQQWARGLERRHLGQRLCRAQLRSRQAGAARGPLPARRRVR